MWNERLNDRLMASCIRNVRANFFLNLVICLQEIIDNAFDLF